MKLEISKRARRHIEKIQAWWIVNRPAAPTLFLDELAAAEGTLRGCPEGGTVYAMHKSGAVRRIHLERTRHHVYFRYRKDRDELIVLAVWGAPRERGPKL